MSTPISSVNADGVFEPFDINRVPSETFSHGAQFGMSYRCLSAFGGGAQITVCTDDREPQPHDVVVFTDAGRVSVKLTGESYRKDATMRYWDGVDD